MKVVRRAVAAILILLIILSIPLPSRSLPAGDESLPFVWNQDSVWVAMEARFRAQRMTGCDAYAVKTELARLDSSVAVVGAGSLSPDDAHWEVAEQRLFDAATRVAACPIGEAAFIRSATRLRAAVKRQSVEWDIASVSARRRLYRMLYGSRAAVEEVLTQNPDSSLALVTDPSLVASLESAERNPLWLTPSAIVHGVRIHSGDLLVSRGGYPTSALIARGSDYPGNFSHVAIAHVDSSGSVTAVEAHIERGVATASAEEYLADKKLRLMVLRVRPDHPMLQADPLLPHRAASYALHRATVEHVPYDFEMDYTDPSRLFCSEVASDAYRQEGVTLWTGISTISSAGLRNWLGAFGVTHFKTQEPSDLEYDPQLVVVAEWRDPDALAEDRIDNAVVDAMLERADAAERLGFPWYQLAPGRLAKAYSLLLNSFGRIGPVPEGMSAAAALRNRAYTERHDGIAERVGEAASNFASAEGYPPPYWRLVDIARGSVAEY